MSFALQGVRAFAAGASRVGEWRRESGRASEAVATGREGRAAAGKAAGHEQAVGPFSFASNFFLN